MHLSNAPVCAIPTAHYRGRTIGVQPVLVGESNPGGKRNTRTGGDDAGVICHYGAVELVGGGVTSLGKRQGVVHILHDNGRSAGSVEGREDAFVMEHFKSALPLVFPVVRRGDALTDGADRRRLPDGRGERRKGRVVVVPSKQNETDDVGELHGGGVVLIGRDAKLEALNQNFSTDTGGLRNALSNLRERNDRASSGHIEVSEGGVEVLILVILVDDLSHALFEARLAARSRVTVGAVGNDTQANSARGNGFRLLSLIHI